MSRSTEKTGDPAAPDVRDAREVGVAVGASTYAGGAPYSPVEAPPEYPFDDLGAGGGTSQAYGTVREALHRLGVDAGRYGTREWNPLGAVVRPGDTVVLKPNFVRDFRETNPDHADCLITHGAILRAVIDYVNIALQGRGRIVVADAPHNDADFAAIGRITQIDALGDFYRRQAGFDLEVYDLRPECARKIDGVIVGHAPLAGDPAGYVKANLGTRSAFMEVNDLCHLLYGSEYDMSELYSHQHDEVHEYLISKTVLDADCVISVPKLKTHKKVGLTVNLKNLVGINGNKNWLPHHREGTPAQGGDQFPDDRAKHRLERSAVTQFKRLFPYLGPLRRYVAGPIKSLGKQIFGDTNTGTVRSGNWYGNDTTWRMVLDLNRILLYADAQGRFHDRPVRRFFSIVDGIVGGEGNGPLDPTPKPAGVVLAGGNPLAVDLACARLMGFDHLKMPMLRRGLEEHPWPLAAFAFDDVLIRSNDARFDRPIGEIAPPALGFAPHSGWKGHLELDGVHSADGGKEANQPCAV